MKMIVETLKLYRRINKLALSDHRIKNLILPYIISSIVIALLPTLANFITAIITNRLQDAHKLSIRDHTTVTILAAVYVCIALLPIFLREIDARISSRINTYLTRHFGLLLKHKLSDLDYVYLDNAAFHDVLKNVREKGAERTWGVFTLQISFMETLVALVTSLIIVSSLKPGYLLILVASVLPLMYILIHIKKGRKELSDRARSEQRFANVYADEAGTRESRVFQLGQPYLQTFDAMSTGILKQLLTFEDKRVVKAIIGWMLHGIGVFVIVNQVYALIITGNLKLGTGLFMLTAMWSFSVSLRVITSLVATFYENIIYAEEYIQVIDLPKTTQQSPTAKPITFTQGPLIVFDNVTFYYPDKTAPALENISLEIKRNTKVAFVGDNGGGKSTMIKLLLGFYNPTFGKILIDGHEFSEITRESWLSIIGYVAQGPSVPNLKIRDVLSYGQTASEDQLMHSLDRSLAWQFIKDYSQGIDQQLGKMFKGGVNPSNGQRQRIAISRAYANNPRLLIFDEPTADLDPEAQNHVFQDFYENNPKTTGIIVAHALQGVMNADMIHVFEKGALSQTGKHTDLITCDGWYKTAFKKQQKHFIPVGI